jgi:hypothetical protein
MSVQWQAVAPIVSGPGSHLVVKLCRASDDGMRDYDVLTMDLDDDESRHEVWSIFVTGDSSGLWLMERRLARYVERIASWVASHGEVVHAALADGIRERFVEADVITLSTTAAPGACAFYEGSPW